MLRLRSAQVLLVHFDHKVKTESRKFWDYYLDSRPDSYRDQVNDNFSGNPDASMRGILFD